MTTNQHKLVRKWMVTGAVSILAIGAILIFHAWLDDHYHAIMYPIFAVILIYVAANKDRINEERSLRSSRKSIGDVCAEQPWLKSYFFIYCGILIFASFYAIYKGIDLGKYIGFFELILIFIGLILFPAYIVAQRNLYIEAGKSNKAFNNDAQ